MKSFAQITSEHFHGLLFCYRLGNRYLMITYVIEEHREEGRVTWVMYNITIVVLVQKNYNKREG